MEFLIAALLAFMAMQIYNAVEFLQKIHFILAERYKRDIATNYEKDA